VAHRTQFEIGGGTSAPATARDQSVEEVRAAYPALADSLARDLRLLVSELVANAVLHGGADTGEIVRLRIEIEGRCVRVAVTDPGAGFMARSEDRIGGWGLKLVERVARSWGIERREGTTTVWFELHDPPPVPA
jgi:anti-sigma regulatory factor (Ser/Thr protein kinase)